VSVGSRHETIEQLNRLLSGAIGIPIVIALVASYRRRPRRHDLVVLSWAMLALFFGNAVLGGIAVMVELSWVSVMGHFLLAIALVGVALTLHQRAGEPDGEVRSVVSDRARLTARIVYVLTPIVRCAGEGTAHMAEQLAFGDRLGQRRAVDVHHRLLRARRIPMDHACEQFLTHAGFAQNEHWQVGGGDGCRFTLALKYRRAFTDQLLARTFLHVRLLNAVVAFQLGFEALDPVDCAYCGRRDGDKGAEDFRIDAVEAPRRQGV
jgi:heme A synthase